MRNRTGAWDAEGDYSIPHAEVVAVPGTEGDALPDGAVQMGWADESGFQHIAHVVKWWRLDRQGLAEGVALQVDVQARQRRDLSCPPHHVSAHLVMTGDTTDTAEVMIGDPHRPGSWAYGVVIRGAVLTSTSVPVRD